MQMQASGFFARIGTPALLACTIVSGAARAQTTITIESWRSDDAAIWNEEIIPAFEATHPGIDVEFTPTPPPGYSEALFTRLENGTAGDLITRRPFDPSLNLFNRGYLAPLNGLAGLENFSGVAMSGCTTDDGATIFCVPIASVIHGFIYNAAILQELALTPPQTVGEFHAVLDAISEDGRYTPLALGTADQWEAATLGFQNVGPAYWRGEEGRRALLSGAGRFTDQPYVDAWTELARWEPHLPENHRTQAYEDSQALFASGQAAVYPAGSWEIPMLRATGAADLGAFPPPVVSAGDECFISDHPDIAIGLNAASPNIEAARTFLTWVASPEFAGIYANALPRYLPASSASVELDDPLAQEFLSWREACESTIRNSYQRLSRGAPNLEDELWRVSAQVMQGVLTPGEAAGEVQAGLDSWYNPGQ
jgi:raffinose/stachyose/melibiose transport system substrate-binding protein